MPTAHIYPLSRLVHAGPGAWQRELADIEAGSTFAFSYYLPMREAVVRFCESRGRNRDAIMQDMTARARENAGPRWANRLRDNTDAFNCFETEFFPRVGRFRRSYLRAKQEGCGFEGLMLHGAPHLAVTDTDGRTRHVFLHAARWSADDLAAYLELLGIIIEEDYGGDARSLWVMDLRAGEDVRWRSSSRMRRRCIDTARLYVRLVNAMGNED
jgi:hypothetical protein